MARNVGNRRSAFTLVELLVSLFLLMIVMVGVNTVFSTTSATVGTNAAISAANRDARAIQSTLLKDFANLSSDGMIILRSEQRFRHRNQKDYESDPTKTTPNTEDPTGSGSESTVRAAAYGGRSHRLDRISFFTRQLLQRQTGNDNTFIANQTTSEQWVWIGHLRKPNNNAFASLIDGDYINPGHGSIDGSTAPANPNNFFANQWTVGRVAIGLVEPTAGVINDSFGNSQNFYERDSDATVTNLSPLAEGAASTQVGGSPKYLFQENRYDLAGTSIFAFRKLVSDAITNTPTIDWWTRMMSGPTSRFRGMPYANRPLDSRAISQLAPVMVSGASQFMIEYAGDFLKQDPANSNVLDTYVRWNQGNSTYDVPGETDGEVDYIIPTTGPNANRRQIMWYGLPRNTSGATTLTYTNGDVVPLRDLWQRSTNAQSQVQGKAPFERTGGVNPTGGTTNILPSEAPTPAAPGDYLATSGGMGAQEFYHCAWGPNDTVRPKLIRIVFTLEDEQGRLPEGQTYEYVFAVP